MGGYSRNVAHRAKKEKLFGTVCCNCGQDCGAEIEYHHIVPLERGGKDTESNLAPLCHTCHTVVHFETARRKPERTGRHRKEYNPAVLDDVFTRYIKREISEKDARAAIGTGCRIKDMVQFKEWAEKNGVDVHQNYGRSGRWYK